MSSERHTRNELSPNSIPREPARRELPSIQIARRVFASIRRILDNEYSSDESQASLPANVIMEREYPYNTNDSLIASNNDNTVNLRVEQTDDLRRSDHQRLTKAYLDSTKYFKY